MWVFPVIPGQTRWELSLWEDEEEGCKGESTLEGHRRQCREVKYIQKTTELLSRIVVRMGCEKEARN